MKFAKQIESASEELPSDWRPHLLHYKSLKKSLRFVVDELQTQGLFQVLMMHKGDPEATITYGFGGDPQHPQPCIHVASEFLSKCSGSVAAEHEDGVVKIVLVRDSEFFRLLMEDLAQASVIQKAEYERMSESVFSLEMELSKATTPQRHKKEMYLWRQIFKLYLDAQIFDNGSSFECSRTQFDKFSDQLRQTGLAQKMTRKNRELLKKFMQMNADLVSLKGFEWLNQTAMTKILKKHDKLSGLSARAEFPLFAKQAIIENVLLSLYSVVTKRLVSVVPQVDSYSCPICYGLAWRPIRLGCNHVFCVRCLIKAQRRRLLDCPICRRKNAVGDADASCLDDAMQDYLMLYFPREIKEKREENGLDVERGCYPKSGGSSSPPTILYHPATAHSRPSDVDQRCTIM
ncbi:SPX domain-domain-containing protein [Syncephalastrum racemosum]|uniref:SPX domain-domain-containing protein n=1 Tax=Syncephalastrum racemosum TaxID=13706 RepID=A0A1X2HFV9_SYNRA|nr:SPX domain-domain-containing protein [Syncephalastrum racemosum]